MQRVQIGITGLAVVFLIVLLAAAVVGFRKDSPANANATNETNVATDEPKDPLAELGVAPGGPPSDKSAPAKAPSR